MRLRWVLSFKADGRAKARLVVVGYQDPRIGSEVKTAAPVISRRGRQLFFVASAHYGFRCCKGDVSGAFLQSDLLNEDGGINESEEEKTRHLVCEPVPELCQAIGL